MKNHLRFDPDYTPKDPQNHFYSIGSKLFEEMIEHAESLSPSSPDYESKPFTVRLPAYQLAAIDALAAVGQMTRQEFLSNLIESSIGEAIVGLAEGLTPHDVSGNVVNDFLTAPAFQSLIDPARLFIFHSAIAALGHEPYQEISMDEALSSMGLTHDAIKGDK